MGRYFKSKLNKWRLSIFGVGQGSEENHTIKQHNKYFYSSLLLFILVINILVYFQYSDSDAHGSNELNLPSKVKLHNGDLVLRNGKGLISSIFRSASLQQPKFTHAGFLFKANNQWSVYHFIDDKKNGGLHIEPLQRFINKESCTSFAFYRYDLSSNQQQQLESIITATSKQHLPFDSNFDLTTDTAMYCTEWIAKTLDRATKKKNYIPQTTAAALTYIAPDNLYLNSHCKIIYTNEY